MSAVSAIVNAPVEVSYDIEKVKLILAGSVISVMQRIGKEMMNEKQAEMTDPTKKRSVADFAKSHTVKYQEEVNGSDEKTQRVFHKLFEATKEQVQKNMMTNMVLMMISQQANAPAANDFLASMVWKETPAVVAKLTAEQPAALDDPSIWK